MALPFYKSPDGHVASGPRGGCRMIAIVRGTDLCSPNFVEPHPVPWELHLPAHVPEMEAMITDEDKEERRQLVEKIGLQTFSDYAGFANWAQTVPWPLVHLICEILLTRKGRETVIAGFRVVYHSAARKFGPPRGLAGSLEAQLATLGNTEEG